jgi:hypothetical protein
MTRVVAVLFLLGLGATAPANTSTGGMRITLERTGCSLDFTCPVYKITIEDDGSIVYEGRRAVHAVGVRKSRIQPSDVRQLAQTLTDKGYFDFPASYGVCEDGPSVKTSLEIGGRIKKIEDGCDAGPPTLRELEDEIDRVCGSRHWVRGHSRTWLH